MINRRQNEQDYETWHKKHKISVTVTEEAFRLMWAKMLKHPELWYSKSHFVECAIRRQAKVKIYEPKKKPHRKHK
jgi:hypothetical protein